MKKSALVPSHEQSRQVIQYQFIYLLLHNRERLGEWVSTNVPPVEAFDENFHYLLKEIRREYLEHRGFLTRDAFISYLKTLPIPKERVAHEFLYNSCYAAVTKTDEYNLLITKLLDDYESDSINECLTTFKDTLPSLTGNKIEFFKALVNDLSPISKSSQSSYSELYEQSLNYREFPLHIFPEALRQTLIHYSKRYNCALDYVANPLLAGIALATGSRILIQARGLVADAKLWVLGIASSSTGKSEPCKPVVSYYQGKDDDAKKEYDHAMSAYGIAKSVYDGEVTSLRRKGELCSTNHPEEPQIPTRREWIFGDGTLEAMNRIIANNSDGTLLYIDDWFGWYSQLAKFNNAKAASELAALQKYFDNEFFTTVKQSRAKEKDSLTIEKHFLCIYANIQPELIQRTLFHEDLRDSGFIHRLLYFFPDKLPYRQPDRDNYQIPAHYERAIPELLTALNQKEYGADSWYGCKLVSLDTQSDEVRETHYIAYAYLDQLEKDDTTDTVLASYIGRLKKHLSKLILNLHCLKCHCEGKPLDTIDLSTVQQACRLMMYYLSQFLKLYDLYFKHGPTDVVPVKMGLSLQDKVRNYVKVHPTVTIKQIQQSTRIQASTIRAILEQLQSDGLGRCIIDSSGRNKGMVTGFSPAKTTATTAISSVN